MRKVVTLIVLTSLLLSCTGNTIYEKPKDLIPKDSMILLLKDLYLASSAKNIKNKKLRRRISYTPLIYNSYKIDSLRFQTSSLYYTSMVDDYKTMLEEALFLLEKDQAVFVKIKKARDSVRQDSIKKIRSKIKKEQINKTDFSKNSKFPSKSIKEEKKKSN